ncbi:peripherin-2-like [Tubulanus polymorphus]|uniref:peripherin-2-like n=1 Tax=Tubulanus polymorphus TaxID=672921 RepID=UPI003DA4513D
MGTYIKLALEEKINLVDKYNSDTLPWMVIAVALASLIINALGFVLGILTQNPERRNTIKQFLLPFICVDIVLAIFIFASGMLAFAHIQHLHHSFTHGILDAMKKYKTTKHIKIVIDQTQMDYECCGGEFYTDWFNVPWVSEVYVDMLSTYAKSKMADGKFLPDDVPFSCCSVKSRRPCIHHRVQENKYHHNYDYRKQTTLHMRGCRDAIMTYFEQMLLTAGGIIVGIFVIRVIGIFVARFLQTAVVSALEKGDPECPSTAWLFGACPTKSTPSTEERELDEQRKGLFDDIDEIDSESSFEVYEKPSQSASSSRRISYKPISVGFDLNRESAKSLSPKRSSSIPTTPPPPPPPPAAASIRRASNAANGGWN